MSSGVCADELREPVLMNFRGDDYWLKNRYRFA